MSWPTPIRNVLSRVLGEHGNSPQALRKIVADYARISGGGSGDAPKLPDNVAAYVEKMTHTPYKMMNSDIETLKQRGFTEDQIFELTLAAALGAGQGRFERTLALIEEKNGPT